MNTLYGQGRDWLPDIGAEEPVVEGRKQEWCGFARDARQGQQDAGENAGQGCRHDHGEHRTGAGRTEREAPSRRVAGTSRSSSSVVRMISGIIMTPNARPPASAENRRTGRTAML